MDPCNNCTAREGGEFSLYVALFPTEARDGGGNYPLFIDSLGDENVHDTISTLSKFDVLTDGLHPDTFHYAEGVPEITTVGLYLVHIKAETYTDSESGTKPFFTILRVGKG